MRRFSKEERVCGLIKNANLEWKMRDHALFAGYAPVINPRYAIVNIIEHGAIGHPHVVLGRDILHFCQQRDPARLPTAYPVTSAAAGPPKKQSSTQPVRPKVGG